MHLPGQRWLAVVAVLVFVGALLSCFSACPDHGDEHACAPAACADCLCQSLALPDSGTPAASAGQPLGWVANEAAFHPLLMPAAIFQPPRA